MGGGLLKFTIELYSAPIDGPEMLLQRSPFTALTPLAARKEAGRMLAARRRATVARVLNDHGELVYELRE